MSGRGKGTKGLVKGDKDMTKITVRHRRQNMRDPMQGIAKPGMRRLARRAGVKRISGSIYHASRLLAKEFLNAILRDAVAVSDYSKRKTVSATDILLALQRNGRILYV
jgi:histone H4